MGQDRRPDSHHYYSCSSHPQTNSFQGPVTIWIMVELPSWRGFLPLSELPMVPGGSLGPQTFRIGMFPFHATRQQLKFFDTSLFLSFLRQFLRLFSAIIRFVFVACWSFCKNFHQSYKKKEIQLGISLLALSRSRNVNSLRLRISIFGAYISAEHIILYYTHYFICIECKHDLG